MKIFVGVEVYLQALQSIEGGGGCKIHNSVASLVKK
jgi:hypothetical protein